MRGKADKRRSVIWKDHVIAAILLMGFAFFINRGIEIKGLYMDDLYMWSCFRDQSFWQYVFPIGGSRFRFLFYLVSWLEMALIGTHVTWMVPVNIILNGGVAITMYGISWKLSRSRLVSFLCGIAYLFSCLSYYQISQGLGVMETMALWMALIILYCLYQFLHDHPKGDFCYLAANLLYLGLCFVHERYMVLFPLFYIILLVKKNRKLSMWIYPGAAFLLVQLIRLVTIGRLSPAGTGGTQVTDTFSIIQSIKYALSQVAYMFGINLGPEHLDGIPWAQAPVWIHLLVYGTIVLLAVMVLCFLAVVIRFKQERKSAFGTSVLFLCFIGACIVSSSVTIRVEMRWVYVSYGAALLYIAYMYGRIVSHVEEEKYIRRLVPYGAIVLGYVVLMFPVQTFYRSYYPKLYYWSNQLRYNSLAEQTYERYGDSLFDKTVYILGNSYEMSEFTADTFFKVYDKTQKVTGPKVVFADSIDEIGLVTDQMLVLREDPQFNGFQDVTKFVRDLKCRSNYGYYEDGWMDEEASVRLMTGSTGKIRMELVYPGSLTGNEISTVFVDGNKALEIRFNENIMHEELQVKPGSLVELKFVNNFYMKDAKEQRGEKRFSMIVNFKAD